MKAYLSRPSTWGVLLGNILEHYDTALFSMLVPFIAPQFFPSDNRILSLILMYLMTPLGLLARPFGAIFLGYIGDRYGRKRSLLVSLFGVAIVTFLIAFIPTYQQVGLFAPLLLSLCRLAQGMFVAGETVGGAVFILENAPKESEDFLSSLYSMTTMFGVILGSLGVAYLSWIGAIETYWRVLYLIGGLTGFVALFLRQALPDDTPEHVSSPDWAWYDHFRALWTHRAAVVVIGIASAFSYACYTIALGFINGFVPEVSQVDRSVIMSVNTVLLGGDLLIMPFFGWLTQKVSRRHMMMMCCVLTCLTGIPLCALMEGASLGTIILIRIALVIIGVAFSAVYHSWSVNLVPKKDRFLVCAVSYALGCQILGAPTASISLWIYMKTGVVSSVAWYWCGLSILAFIGIYTLRELKESDLESVGLNP